MPEAAELARSGQGKSKVRRDRLDASKIYISVTNRIGEQVFPQSVPKRLGEQVFPQSVPKRFGEQVFPQSVPKRLGEQLFSISFAWMPLRFAFVRIAVSFIRSCGFSIACIVCTIVFVLLHFVLAI